MLKVELSGKVITVGINTNNIVEAEHFETAEDAERNGFYWFDEIGKWVNVEKLNEYYDVK